MDMPGSESQAVQGNIPRPAGNVGIKTMTFDLVDTNGNPTDAATIQALNDACCAQVEWWLQNGDEFGDLSRIGGYSIEGLAVTYKQPPPGIAPRAKQVLRVAGIYPSQTPIHLP